MKIGFVLDDGLDKPDGVQQYILTLGNWYKTLGHEVRYLVGETNRPDIEGVYSMARNVKVRFNGNALSIPFLASRKKIKKILHEEQFDVLHIQTPYHPFMGAQVIKNAPKSVAIVGTFHILPYGRVSWVGTKLLGIWLRSSLKRFDVMVAVSKPAALFAKQTFSVDSLVIPNSVDTTQFKHAPKVSSDESLRILFLGRLVHRKGCGQLLKALTLLQTSGKLPANLVVDICGDGPLRSKLEAFIAQNNLQDIVRFHGFVSNEEKINFMQQADIAVFPSLSGESFGIVLIEAMAAGSGVVLAGNNPGYSSVLGELPGSMIEPQDPRTFADQLNDMIISKEKRQALYDLQQKHVTQFDTAVVAAQLLELYGTCKTTQER